MMKKTMALMTALVLMLSATCAQATGIVIGGGGGGVAIVGGADAGIAMPVSEGEDDGEVSNAPMIKTASGGSATIFPRTQDGETYDYAEDSAVSGGKLYIRGSRLYAYEGGAEEVQTLVDYTKIENGSSMRYITPSNMNEMELTDEQRAQYEAYPSYLVSGGDALYGVNALSGAFGPVVDGFIQKTVNLKWDDMFVQDDDYTYNRSISSFVLTDGALYAALGPQSNGYSYNEFVLVKYDTATGERTQTSVAGAMSVVPYKDGKLLIGGYGTENSWGKQLSVYDPAADAVEKVLIASRENYNDASSTGLGYNAGGFAYDAASDTIYFYQEGEVFATKDGTAMESVAYVATNGVSDDGAAGILTGGFYAIETYDGLYVRSLDPANRPERALRILGGYMDDTARGFADENPNIPVVFVDRWLSGAESIRNDMVSGDSNVDLYVVNLRSGFSQLMEKDYLMDLSASQELVDDVKTMYPQITDALMKDGKLYGYPQSFNLSAWMFNESAWEKLGLGERPTTFEEFFAGLADWEENYAEANPEYCYINLYSGKEQLFSMLLQQYVAQYDTGEAPLKLSDPKFLNAIKQVEAMELPTYDWSTMTQEEMDAANELFNRKWLFETYSYNMLGRIYYQDDDVIKNIAPMTFAEGEDPAMLVDMSVYIVNPNSPNVDIAMQYLAYCAQNMQSEIDYMIHPDRSEPVRDPYYDRNIKEMKKYLAELEEQLEKAEEVEKVDIQAQIDSYKEWIEEYSQNEWSISAESIANYRELADKMVLGEKSTILSYGDEAGAMSQLQEILTRYFGGQLSAEQMTQEMDKKLQMIYMENQ